MEVGVAALTGVKVRLDLLVRHTRQLPFQEVVNDAQRLFTGDHRRGRGTNVVRSAGEEGLEFIQE
jgi:hypothetical protein